MTIEQLVKMFTSDCAVTSLIGAFLLCAASYFIPVGIDFRKRPLGHSALFLVAGYFAGALISRSAAQAGAPPCAEPGALYCAALGAGWPYLAVSLKGGGKAIAKAIGDRLSLGAEKGKHLFDPPSGADLKSGANDG